MRSLAKKVVPKALVRLLKQLKVQLGRVLVRIAARSRVFANIYYVFNQDFAWQHHAVLRGRESYFNQLKKVSKSSALLRRNTHRLEKGLIMRPRRAVFAESFILETVHHLRDALQTNNLCANEEKWVTDVLDEYFAVVSDTPTILQARNIYKGCAKPNNQDSQPESYLEANAGAFRPYTQKSLPKSNIPFEQLQALFIQRRSVRWYQDKAVPVELAQQLAQAASFAPSACNRQPYRFLFCNDKAKTKAIASCVGGTAGFVDNLPSIIVVVGNLSAYPFERDRHLIYIDSSLASMQLMLAAETVGLSTCPINWPDVAKNEKKIREEIELEDYERVIMLMAVGYADTEGGIPYSQKKSHSLLVEHVTT
jgi:nitroreductase